MHFPLLDSFPLSAAIKDLRTNMTYDHSTFRKHVTKIAKKHILDNVSPGEPVVVGDTNPINVLALLFANWANGNPVVLVNPGLKPVEQEIVIEHTGATHWFGPHAQTITPHLLRNKSERPLTEIKPIPLSLDEPALILMTSGTTGTPKGIVHTIRTLKTRIALNISFLEPKIMSHSLCILPLFFGHGLIGNCLTPLAAGQTLHLLTSPTIPEITNIGATLDEHNITFMSSVPTFWKLALRMEPPKIASLKRVCIGSSPLSFTLWNDVKDWTNCDSIFNMYGMTETANWIGGGDLMDADENSGYVGRIWGGHYAVRMDDGKISEHGRGEVLVDSPSMMVGYLNATENKSNTMTGEWFRTGDIGELSPKGDLVLIGRSKTEINRGGIKILAEEIDMMLERHPAIFEACAFGIVDDVSGEAVAAAVVLNDGAQITAADLREWCRTQVRNEAVPTKIFITAAIPKNARGKIVRHDVMRQVSTNRAENFDQ